ncbi:EVE domain-containing protein [Oleispirillum naphthae]|uniref:EVE domain-containing protein n=1 Tax=Oleispirillum naphthae TaxID=2838853 RepID=UPI003082361A
MAHWLIKSEPGEWGWDDQVKVESEAWTGVRNHQAARNLKAMRVGDTAFFYHSVTEKRIAGIVAVVGEAEPDPTDESGRFVAVRVKAVRPFEKPVTLADVKADPMLAELPLVRQSRLSVMPIPDDAWAKLCALGGVDP